jgi:hypothetical protein
MQMRKKRKEHFHTFFETFFANVNHFFFNSSGFKNRSPPSITFYSVMPVKCFFVSSSLEQSLDGEDLEMQDLDTRYCRVP